MKSFTVTKIEYQCELCDVWNTVDELREKTYCTDCGQIIAGERF